MSFITGSAKDIYDLIELAQVKILDGEEHPGIEVAIRLLIVKLNSPEFRMHSNYELKPGNLQRNILFNAKRLVIQERGHLGLAFLHLI
ncbi:MAG: hypothetical protein IPH20_14275 [Bacteroidales bacterium]|nr:hypothetical protein [Bacteroidales bacterium]